ncbi:ankyrin repeat domain-containing protein 39 [Leguminivora glycinivorella]|uniref:ankyrin repeat domain-containing protein 39 n=1 Tax=Leguminivora glycinivorella TaxID=1035111 RepID=UPI00200CC87D|nr:ankyrin repeat domain-containing protein 39 [Leguminivora glycinivorella]
MDHVNCDHTHCTTANKSVCQTLSEMEWERGIWNAAFNGDKEKVNMLIQKAKNAREFVNMPDNSGYTALHYAARNGHVDICRTLLETGACVDAQTSGMATPLHKAAVAGKAATLKFLIQHGANILMQDTDGQTALHKAVANKRTELINILLETCPELANVQDKRGRVATELSQN